MRHKVLLVFGTRPEAIKMIPLALGLLSNEKEFETEICVTGQHREMLRQVLDIFKIQPDYDLDIMKAGQDLYDVTAKVLLGMREVLAVSRPDIVMVHGDTTTSIAAALAAFYAHIPVGHVEAGLRTYDKENPWPEELNRQITGRIASLHFAPTLRCQDNLLKEGVCHDSIVVTGNTVIDSLFNTLDRIDADFDLKNKTHKHILEVGYDLNRLSEGRRLILVTGHRRENIGNGILNICSALNELSDRYPDTDFVYPVHPNPNVRNAVFSHIGKNKKENIFLIEPLGYLSFIYLMKHSYIILTDSGGVQEEAPSMGVPVLVTREVTERPEAIEAGTVAIVGTDTARIVQEVSSLLDNPDKYDKMRRAVNPYGDGKAVGRIIDAIREFFKNS